MNPIERSIFSICLYLKELGFATNFSVSFSILVINPCVVTLYVNVAKYVNAESFKYAS